MTWRRVDRAELVAASGNDPYLAYAAGSVALGVVGPHGWAVLHRWRPTGFWGGAAVVGEHAPGDAESTALEALRASAPEVPLEWFSTAPGRALHLPAGLRVTNSGRWDFLSTSTTPPAVPLPPGAGLVSLDDATDAARITSFALRHNPDFEGFPGLGYALAWRGVTDPAGHLLAVGALHELDTGLPHLSGLVVHTEHRRRGLGRLLTVELTRAALDGYGGCSLGVYSENRPAIGLYHALGYTTDHSFHTRDVLVA